MYAGTHDGGKVYGEGHVKVVSFRDRVKQIKCGDLTNVVYSIFRKELWTTVEEQFSDLDVPSALVTASKIDR